MRQGDEQVTAYVDLACDDLGGVDELSRNIGRLRGRAGRTKERIECVSGCKIDGADGRQDRHLPIHGTKRQVRLGGILVRNIIAQHREHSNLVLEDGDLSESCTVLQVPESTRKMVLGKNGEHLMSLQDDSSTIMFFAEIRQKNLDHVIAAESNVTPSYLIIFGSRRGRRLAQLLVMALVESIEKGYFAETFRMTGRTFDCPFDCYGGWGTTVLPVRELALLLRDEFNLKAGTRDKLMQVSGCIIVPVGSLIFVSGSEQQRGYAIDYMDMRLAERFKDKYVSQVRKFGNSSETYPEDREDCTLVHMPHDCVCYVVGKQFETLRKLENAFGVLIFNLSERRTVDETSIGILGRHKRAAYQTCLGIFGNTRARCSCELVMMDLVEHSRPGIFSKKMLEKTSSARGFARDVLCYPEDEAMFVRGNHKNIDGFGYLSERELSAASNTILKFVGAVCVISGEIDERRRCRDYVEWSLASGPRQVAMNGLPRVDATARSDITQITRDQFWDLKAIRQIGIDTETLILLTLNSGGKKVLIICGHKEESRTKAEELINRHSHRREKRTRDAEKAKRWSPEGDEKGRLAVPGTHRSCDQKRSTKRSCTALDLATNHYDHTDSARKCTGVRERSRSPPPWRMASKEEGDLQNSDPLYDFFQTRCSRHWLKNSSMEGLSQTPQSRVPRDNGSETRMARQRSRSFNAPILDFVGPARQQAHSRCETNVKKHPRRFQFPRSRKDPTHTDVSAGSFDNHRSARKWSKPREARDRSRSLSHPTDGFFWTGPSRDQRDDRSEWQPSRKVATVSSKPVAKALATGVSEPSRSFQHRQSKSDKVGIAASACGSCDDQRSGRNRSQPRETRSRSRRLPLRQSRVRVRLPLSSPLRQSSDRPNVDSMEDFFLTRPLSSSSQLRHRSPTQSLTSCIDNIYLAHGASNWRNKRLSQSSL